MSNLMPGDNSGPGGPDAPEPDCRNCDGTGTVCRDDFGYDEDVTCPHCDGSGYEPYEGFVDLEAS